MGVKIVFTILAVRLLLLTAVPTKAAEPIDVWLDVDTATGIGDVDDGLMLIQSFHSPEIHVRGISVVFGNAPLRLALPICAISQVSSGRENCLQSRGPPQPRIWASRTRR